MTNKNKQLRQTRELFAAVGLKNWQEQKGSHQLGRGGQAGVLIVKEEGTDREGVFRCLTEASEANIERFYRELRILTTFRYKHPNVVELLEYTQDNEHQWYISRRGHSFKSSWECFRNQHLEEPIMLLETAIDVILQLADGIAELHTAGVIHRDIKPANIIVDSAHGPIRPILIDFGIAHVEYEQRLTDGNDPVGNQGYSHDVMMNRMDRVPPWLDIFQLSQLLIWMIQVQPGKRHWDRPLDWRFVRYDDRLPENLAVGVRAITALCSEERISPQNGRELAFLVRERISLVTPSRVKSTVVDLATIHEGIAKGKSIQDIHIANDLRAIEASAISMYAVYSQLRQGLEELAQRLHDGNVPFAKSVDVGRADFIETLVNGNGNVTEVPLYQLDFGNSSSQRFHFRVNCFVVVPSLKDYMNAPVLPESSNIIRLYLQRYANLVRVTFPHITKVVTFERDGTLWLRNEQLTECEKTDVAELLRQIENWITDLPPWEMIQRDR